MKRVLLHICCGICLSWPAEKLSKDDFKVSGFFYNPNIHPEEEYRKRLKVAQEVASKLGLDLIVGPYSQENWFKLVRGLEDEPEGGKRCLVCYRMRLERTYALAKELSFDYFTTTLSVSPHKNSRVIHEIGRVVGADSFLAYDFKKEGGFKRMGDFAKAHNLYRQHYCGCYFSQSVLLKKIKKEVSDAV